MEYRWKEITKMGEISAKTYSMWNGQIPCGIRGQGKDLKYMFSCCQKKNEVKAFNIASRSVAAKFATSPV